MISSAFARASDCALPTRYIAASNHDKAHKVLDANAIGVLSLLKHASKAMITAKNGGSMRSAASCAGLGCPPSMIAYGASKAAVNHMSKIAALDLAPHSIRVSSASPALIGPEDGFMWKRQGPR